MSAATGVWAFVLLDRTPDWMPALRWIVLAGSVVVAAMLAVGAHRRGRAAAVLAAAAAFSAWLRPPHMRSKRRDRAQRTEARCRARARTPASATVARRPGWAVGGTVRVGEADNAALAELVEGLDNRWAAASVGSMGVSSLELKTGASIMAIGGFTGGDDSPTLAQFQAYVANHEVRYFIAGERVGPPGHRQVGRLRSEITAWVQQNFTPDRRRRRHRLRPQPTPIGP